MMQKQEGKGNILLVDDQPDNLWLLEQMLGREGYDVRSFPCGQLAIAAARQDPPDLILLDIHMPEMDGYQVCSRLKADDQLNKTPVIFLSALNETGDKMKAFHSGGVDYITKPFQFDEVRARVETHCRLHRLQCELRTHNGRLEELVTVRTRELAEANSRLKILDQAKTDFLKLISHEFRTPLNGLLGVGDILLYESSPDAELRDMFEQSRQRILTILDDASVLTQIEVGMDGFVPARLSLDRMLHRAGDQAVSFARTRGVTIGPAEPTGIHVHGVEDLLVKALQSVLETAVRFADSGSAVRIVHRPGGDSAIVVIESTGRTIPPHLIGKFFDLFSVGEAIAPNGDFGLGPAVAQRILSLFGGSVTVANRESAGILLTVSAALAG
jgi:two-component system sensor histidine kinase/response regulator